MAAHSPTQFLVGKITNLIWKPPKNIRTDAIRKLLFMKLAVLVEQINVSMYTPLIFPLIAEFTSMSNNFLGGIYVNVSCTLWNGYKTPEKEY